MNVYLQRAALVLGFIAIIGLFLIATDWLLADQRGYRLKPLLQDGFGLLVCAGFTAWALWQRGERWAIRVALFASGIALFTLLLGQDLGWWQL